MVLELLEASEVTAVSVAEVKEHLGIDNNSEDSLLHSYIKAASSAVENMTGRVLLTQRWRQLFVGPKLPLILLKRPVVEVVEVKYLEDGQEVIWEPEEYGLLGFKIEGESLPSRYIYVDYKAGFGVGPDDVPEDIKQVIKLLVAYWYNNRSEVTKVPEGFKELLSSYRTISF
ncbi:head-tail connector protein [Halonatronum saccharophilum]|uniref:head-tail connector protein n=1 Tax=Halonatronum saccharophilum TaxID=150060 RepID=UPI0004814CE1|nr:head-tail connector protein [Halonatronum saccharophilum]